MGVATDGVPAMVPGFVRGMIPGMSMGGIGQAAVDDSSAVSAIPVNGIPLGRGSRSNSGGTLPNAPTGPKAMR